MPDRRDGLTPAQARAVTRVPGPIAIVAKAGTGKTRVLVERFAWLVERGAAPEAIVVLTLSAPAADELRGSVERALGVRPFEELAVSTVPSFALRLLRDEALEAGLEAFVLPATPADRLALLLERVDELPLARHDLAGNPTAALARILARIDASKDEGVTASAHAAWAAALPGDAEGAEREREFAALYAAHDRMLAERGALDTGDLVLRAHELLAAKPHVRARTAERFAHVLVDDYQDLTRAQARLVGGLVAEHGSLVVALDPDQRLDPTATRALRNLETLRALWPELVELPLGPSLRTPECIARAAEAVVAPLDRSGLASRSERLLGREPQPAPAGTAPPRQEARAGAAAAAPGEEAHAAAAAAAPGEEAHAGATADAPGEVRFWRCANERAQAQATAAEVERLVRDGVPAERIGVLVRSVRDEGQAVAVALEERAIAHRLVGAAALFAQAEVRDVLAWLRLLVDPGDAAAVVRALVRPPVELRSVDLARCVQIARRRKLDMVGALGAALESPQLPPEARDRIMGFLRLHRQAAAALDTTQPDLFVHRLIERLGLRRQQLFAAQPEVVERLVHLARLGELATAHVRRAPQASAREWARHITAVADAGLREEEATGAEGERSGMRAGIVEVLGMHAARGLEFDHVFVLGLQSSRMPGTRSALVEPVPAALLADDAGRTPAKPHPSGLDRHSADGAPCAAHAAHMRRLLHTAMTRARRGLVLAYAAGSDRGARQNPSPFAEEARAALGAAWEERGEELFGPDEALHATFTQLRDELLGSVARVGGRIGELRLDTDLDVSHGVTRYLELVKLSALLERPAGQSVADALADVNARLLQAASAQQREVFQTSGLDDWLLDAERDAHARVAATAAREEPSLEAFLPRRGDGLLLSASDIETYRSCPLKYKFARVFRIPQEPTMNQRFGILVHQVLERWHAARSTSREELLALLDAGWRRGGFGDSEEERQFRAKAVASLHRYFERDAAESSEPAWLEKAFQFRLGPHVLRGRVDRVDRLADGGYELIDYKTGRPRTTVQLREDVQLSLYAVAAKEAWKVESSSEAYHYVLDDEKVRVPAEELDRDWITDTVARVAEGIQAQGFEPTPSSAACSWCDYRIVCPAAER